MVKPFISNKIVKSFVDLCLVEDEECLTYMSVEKQKNLNEFEKVLLIKYLFSHGQKERAEDIAKSMQLVQKSKKISFDQYKKEFDTVINAKKSDDSRNDYNEPLMRG